MIKRDKKTGTFLKGNNSGRRFTSESSRGNKNAKGNPANKTSFKEGQFTMETHRNWNGGVQVMKKDCVWLTIASNVRVRRPVYIYEQAYGKLPPGHVIYHKDGDRYNDDLDNLEAITRAELVQRNRRFGP